MPNCRVARCVCAIRRDSTNPAVKYDRWAWARQAPRQWQEALHVGAPSRGAGLGPRATRMSGAGVRVPRPLPGHGSAGAQRSGPVAGARPSAPVTAATAVPAVAAAGRAMRAAEQDDLDPSRRRRRRRFRQPRVRCGANNRGPLKEQTRTADSLRRRRRTCRPAQLAPSAIAGGAQSVIAVGSHGPPQAIVSAIEARARAPRSQPSIEAHARDTCRPSRAREPRRKAGRRRRVGDGRTCRVTRFAASACRARQAPRPQRRRLLYTDLTLRC